MPPPSPFGTSTPGAHPSRQPAGRLCRSPSFKKTSNKEILQTGPKRGTQVPKALFPRFGKHLELIVVRRSPGDKCNSARNVGVGQKRLRGPSFHCVSFPRAGKAARQRICRQGNET